MTSWTKRFIVIGLIAIPIVSFYFDPATGKDLSTLVVVGFIGMLKLEG